MRTYVSKNGVHIPSVYARAMSTTHFRSVLRTSCYNKISELVINLVTLSYAVTIFTTTHVLYSQRRQREAHRNKRFNTEPKHRENQPQNARHAR